MLATFRYQTISKDVVIKHVAKDPIPTEFDVDLHEKMAFHTSHFFLLQIIERLINTAVHQWKPRSATHGYLWFELPAFIVLDEDIVQGRLDYALRVELKM